MKNFLLSLSGFLYGLIAALHLVRFFLQWPVTIGSIAIPLEISLWASGVFFLLTLVYFLTAAVKR